MTRGAAERGANADRGGDPVGEQRLLYGSMTVLVVVLIVGFRATMADPRPRVWLAPIGVLFLAAIPLAPRARVDPVWYGSIVVPALAATLIGPFLPGPFNVAVSIGGVLLVVPWLVGPRLVTDWWWFTVLRRPRWSAGRRFDRQLRQELHTWAAALAGAGALSPDQDQAAREALERMQAMSAPDPAWSDMRDDYLRECRRWIDTPRDEAHAEEWAAINRDFEALNSRRLDLVERTR